MNINFYLDKFFGIEIIRTRPKESIKFAKRYFKNRKIYAAEIGVLRGQNSKDILDSLNIIKIYLIDPYLGYEDYLKSEKERTQISLTKIEKKAHYYLKKYSEKIEWIKEYSENVIDKIPSEIDFIYIDGNHEYGYVKKDLELYWNKLKVGGILSGHDIQYLGVSKAVLEFANSNHLEVHFGDRRDWWIMK